MSSVPSIWIWLGIVACVLQSAAFSGLNLAVFSLSQMRLQIEADGGNADAARVLALRGNSNQVLATIIWGNVSTNVLLTLLSDSVLASGSTARGRSPTATARSPKSSRRSTLPSSPIRAIRSPRCRSR
jgi:CBS domain containing-hemolysin-like protein